MSSNVAMAELVDALVSDASGEIRGSSSLLSHTKIINNAPYGAFIKKICTYDISYHII